MSNQFKKSAATPFCKFCEGAGESKEVYTSHWQFSQPKDGVLTCPKLLKYKCKICNSHGHIEKRCSAPRQARVKEERTEKFCRFCYNAKNPDFLEHNQFDNDGFVQCPALLDIECQNCGEKGHTKRYCSEPQSKTLTIIMSPKEEVLEPRVVPRAPKKPANKFAALLVEEEDEEVDTLQSGSLTLFPMLSEKQSTVNSMMGGWTTAVKGKPEPVKTRPAPPSRPPPLPETVIKCKEPEVQLPPRPTKPVPQLPLVTEPISDTEEEEDDEDKPSTFVPKPSTSWADEE